MLFFIFLIALDLLIVPPNISLVVINKNPMEMFMPDTSYEVLTPHIING
jgi:hypothetical protein